MRDKTIKQLSNAETDAVNGAGDTAYYTAYVYARLKGATHEQAKAVGEVASAVEDALTGA